MKTAPAQPQSVDMTKGLARMVRGWLFGAVVGGGVSAVLLVCQFVLFAHLVDLSLIHISEPTRPY